MSNLSKKKIISAIITAIIASIVLDSTKLLEKPIIYPFLELFHNSPDQVDPLIVRPLTYFIVFVVVALFIMIWKNFTQILSWLSISIIIFLALGLKKWAEKAKKTETASELWNWVSDQVLVIQGRYAFALGCIVFKKTSSNNKYKFLLIPKKFNGFDDDVFLWPGGRLRGVETDFPDEINNLVYEKTGCSSVKLVGDNNTRQRIDSIGARGSRIKNELNPAPLFIMRQNREQRNGIPGHMDLIFIAELLGSPITENNNVRWVTLEDLENKNLFPEKQLWPDTLEVIRAAAAKIASLSRV